MWFKVFLNKTQYERSLKKIILNITYLNVSFSNSSISCFYFQNSVGVWTVEDLIPTVTNSISDPSPDAANLPDNTTETNNNSQAEHAKINHACEDDTREQDNDTVNTNCNGSHHSHREVVPGSMNERPEQNSDIAHEREGGDRNSLSIISVASDSVRHSTGSYSEIEEEYDTLSHDRLSFRDFIMSRLSTDRMQYYRHNYAKVST